MSLKATDIRAVPEHEWASACWTERKISDLFMSMYVSTLSEFRIYSN